MRIQRLDLIAFGPFTDESLEFSQQGPGLQIVYGPNEAGKSSSLRAITDLLFGIHARSKEDFVHPYAKLKLGARILDSKGKPFDFVRLKKNKNSLQSPDESESYPDDALDRFLGNVNRDLFVSMFGIDHERLRAGGEEIVQGKGDIGELLFSAGAGLTNLRTLQGELVEQSDRLLKPPPGRSGEIAEQIKTYGVYRAELRDLQVSVDTWKSLTAARDACETRKANLDEAIKKVRTQQNRLQRLGDAIPLIGRWRALSDELKYLGDAPILTGDFAERSQKRLQDLRVDEQRHSAASQKLKELKAELAGLSVTEELLCRADEIKQLVESLGAHRKALRDQPRLIQTVEFNEHEIIEILKKLGREPDVSKLDQLRVPKMQQERIQKLGNQQEFILSQPKVHQKECERLRREHARVEKKIAETTVPPELDRLRHAVRDAMSKGDLEEQLEALLDEIAELEQQAATCLTQLPFWDGPLSEIARMEVPFPATVDQYQDRFKDQESAIRQLEKEIAKTEREYEQLEIDLQSLEATHRIPTLEELEQTRSLREAGFELIIQAWREGKATEEEIEAYIKQRESAEDLETAYRSYVDEADQIADQLRAGAEQVANKQKLIAERMRSERQLASLHDQLEKAREVRRDCEEEWNLVWEPLNIAPGTPAEMKEWLRARQEIAALVGHLEAKQRDADRVQNQIDTHREKLANLLTEIDSQSISRAATLEELISAANDSLDENERRISQLAQWREELGKLETGLEEAESELAQAEQDRDEWLANWSKAVKVIGLGGDAQADEANSLLSDLSSIFEKYQEVESIRIRLRDMEADAIKFQNEVRTLAPQVDESLAELPLEEVVTTLDRRLSQAETAVKVREGLVKQQAEQQQILEQAEAGIQEGRAVLEEMCREAGCDEYDQLAEAADRSRRRIELEKAIDDLNVEITNRAAGQPIAEFIAEAEQIDADSIEPQIAEREESVRRLEAERDDCVREWERHKVELEKIDGSAAASEKAEACESLAAAMENQLQRLAVLRVASAVLHTAMEQYRDQNQDPVLKRASEFFREMTLNSFSWLQADFDESGSPVIKGVRQRDGQLVDVSGMSDGTCDQLFLSLRLASLEMWLGEHEPIPFIVDDIFLNFDDERALAGLKALIELSRFTQVILFTHHQHLVDLIRDSLGAGSFSLCQLRREMVEEH